MRVIVPVTPTLNSSTVAEPDTGETVWNSGTTYGLGAEVISTTYHEVYESRVAGNLNHALPVPPETQNDYWIRVRATNKYACLDLKSNSQTIGASPMTIVVTPGQRINSLALMGLEAEAATITIVANSETVYTRTYDLRLRRVRNGYEYFFKPFDLQRAIVEFDIPPFTTAQITIVLTRTTGDVKIGAIVPGNYVYLGATQPKPVSDAENFSEINRDEFGQVDLVQRRSLPTTSQVLEADKAITDDLLDARELLNAIPAVWSGLDDEAAHEYFNALLILGIYRRFKVDMEHPESTFVYLDLEAI
jgi:hypothetical protein